MGGSLEMRTGRNDRRDARPASLRPTGWVCIATGWMAAVLFCIQPLASQAAPPAEPPPFAVLEIEGKVEVMRGPNQPWDLAYTNQVLLPGNRLRTGPNSRAVVRWSNLSLLRLDQRSYIEIPTAAKPRPILNLLRGALYFFHGDKPGVFPIGTPSMSAVVRGTEFHLQVDDEGTTLHLLDGQVDMTNDLGQLSLRSGEAGKVAPGQAPIRTAALPALNVVQWCLYYPGVLDVAELGLAPAEEEALRESLAAYRAGDLSSALAQYPADRRPASAEERIYLAALLLTVGQVEQTERLIGEVEKTAAAETRAGRLGRALRKMIAAVKFQPWPADSETALPQAASLRHGPGSSTSRGSETSLLATERVAESYYQQSRADIEAALAAARIAINQSPQFAFAWVRVAELEFSFGRNSRALEALETSLRLAPRNAQALALKGFVLCAQNRIGEGRRLFEQAMAVDGALGNAWLGRGLCRIQQRDTAGGLNDLQVAATLEPQRALLRSYLGKAYSQARDQAHASREIRRAQELDPQDPTGWLYSALLNQQQNRINQAVRDLEQSQALNDNRRVYRSRLLLDQDRAVRGVNLANVYQDAGLFDVSVWEAGRAVNDDYASFSAHLFLANSYQRLRDPKGINLRYETPAVNEYLLASLLAPASAGTLAQSVSQQEYTRLFEQDGLGLASSTEYLSRGDWIQSAVQYGTIKNSSYAVSDYYRKENGQRHNNDLEQTELSWQFQQQITPTDSVYVRAILGLAEGGDLAQYYDPDAPYAEGGPNLLVRSKETQQPMLLAGYHHEWAPGSHLLVLGGRFQDTLRVANPQQQTLVLGHDATGNINAALPITIEQTYRSELEIYSAEVQQLWQLPRHSFIVGTRYQNGQFDTENQHTNASFGLPFLFPTDGQSVDPDMERVSAYGYWLWQVAEPLQLEAGLSYDRLTYPLNYRFAPLSEEEETTDQFSPKGGLIWTPTGRTTVRAGYTRSLGGVSFDQSFRLEPTQVAGFNQAFRSLIPESVAGANAAATFETWGVSLEQKVGRNTYLGWAGEILNSEVDRVIGVYDFEPFVVTRGGTREAMDYTERSMAISLHQLISQEWSLGVRYRLSQAELSDRFRDIPSSAALGGGFQPHQDWESVLHQVNLFALYTHRCGFFGQAEALWHLQSNHGYSPDRPGDDFWQFNLFAGYRFPQRQAELKAGLLNIFDQDYRLNPLNLTEEYSRDRTLLLSLRFYF
jgi:Tfp pilus assembly protein PilF